jgi:hypothetical protein
MGIDVSAPSPLLHIKPTFSRPINRNPFDIKSCLAGAAHSQTRCEIIIILLMGCDPGSQTPDLLVGLLLRIVRFSLVLLQQLLQWIVT